MIKALRRWRSGPMSCKTVGRLLQAYLDGELDATRGEALAAHLEECRRCGLEAATYEQIKGALAARGRLPDDDAAVRRLQEFAQNLIDQNLSDGDKAGP
ncbi:MAG: anti-sigma factor family protein [Acidimicrobiales bacterium]